MKTICVGIDLGTTNSAMSVLVGTKKKLPKILKLSSGKTTIPSCVQWLGGEEFIVGDEAYNNRSEPNVAFSMKKYMGTDYTQQLEYNGETRDLTALEFSTLILKELKKEIENIYGVGINYKVTITCPAYFNDKQRQATRKAGALAGWDVVRIINEPTSATLAYGVSQLQKSETVLAFDLGGGTFDVNVIRLIKNISKGNEDFPLLDLTLESDDTQSQESLSVRILSTDGDTHLGGDDFDTYLLEEVLHSVGIEAQALTSVQYNALLLELEQAKKNGVDRGRYIRIGTQHLYVDENLYRKAYNKVWERCLAIVKRCLASSRDKEIDKVVMIGGSTKLSWYKDDLKKLLGSPEIYDSLNPDESVALGASVQTGLALGEESNMSVTDVLPIGIGIELEGGIIKPVIRKDTPIPCLEKFDLTFNLSEKIRKLVIPIYQGVKKFKEQNTHLGDVEVNAPPDSGLTALVSCTLKIDLNGLLTLIAECDSDKVTAQFKTEGQSSDTISSTKTEGQSSDTVSSTNTDTLVDGRYIRWKMIIEECKDDELKDKGLTLFQSWVLNRDNKNIQKELQDIIKEIKRGRG